MTFVIAAYWLRHDIDIDIESIGRRRFIILRRTWLYAAIFLGSFMSPLFKASSHKTCPFKMLFQSYLRLYRCLFLVCITLLGAPRCLLLAATNFSSLSLKLVFKVWKKKIPEMFVYLELGY